MCAGRRRSASRFQQARRPPGRPAQALIAQPSYDLSAAKSAIDRVEQSAGGTDLPGALNLALQIGRDENTQPRKYLDLFTDGTRSAFEKKS